MLKLGNFNLIANLASAIPAKQLLVLTSCLACFLFGGIVYGFPNLRLILERDGQFAELCRSDGAIFRAESVGSECSAKSASCPLDNCTVLERGCNMKENTFFRGHDGLCCPIQCPCPTYNATIERPSSPSTPGLSFSEEVTPICAAQDDQYNLMYTVATCVMAAAGLPAGILYDRLGPSVGSVTSMLRWE